MAHPKSELNDRSQKYNLGKPSFRTNKTGAEHDPSFHSEVLIDGTVVGRGEGGQKRDAERSAAKNALAYLDETGNRVLREAAPFEGPWPIFPEVLAASLNVANSRLDSRLKGEEAVGRVRGLALTLYKETLEALGEVVEVED